MLEFRNHALGNPVRLSIMIYLLPRERALFKELHEILEITPGNLNSHLKRLEKEGYVRIKKVIADRPRTAVEITLKGAEETGKYNVLEPTTTAINLARLR